MVKKTNIMFSIILINFTKRNQNLKICLQGYFWNTNIINNNFIPWLYFNSLILLVHKINVSDLINGTYMFCIRNYRHYIELLAYPHPWVSGYTIETDISPSKCHRYSDLYLFHLIIVSHSQYVCVIAGILILCGIYNTYRLALWLAVCIDQGGWLCDKIICRC